MEKEYSTEKFRRGLDELGIALSEAQIERFFLFGQMLLEGNRRTNLTAITEPDEVMTKHFLDSLCLVKAVPEPAGRRVIDVGSGAGFPGIPLAIAFPEAELVLVDSVGKKTAFEQAVVDALKLSNVTVAQGRVENLAKDSAYRQQFDLCVSRAVADLAVLAEYSLPFVRLGGQMIAYKGDAVDTECARAQKAVSLLGGETAQVIHYTLPGTADARSLVCVDKREMTPDRYPRNAGKPAKRPLQ